MQFLPLQTGLKVHLPAVCLNQDGLDEGIKRIKNLNQLAIQNWAALCDTDIPDFLPATDLVIGQKTQQRQTGPLPLSGYLILNTYYYYASPFSSRA